METEKKAEVYANNIIKKQKSLWNLLKNPEPDALVCSTSYHAKQILNLQVSKTEQ